MFIFWCADLTSDVVNDFLVSDNEYVQDYEVMVMGFKDMAKSFNMTSRSRPVESFDCCSFKMIYESKSREVLSLSNMKAICEFERILVEDPTRPLFCKTSKAEGMQTICDPDENSLAAQFYDFSKDLDCGKLNEVQYEEALDDLSTAEENFHTEKTRRFARSQFTLGGPLGPDSTDGRAFTTLMLDPSDPQYKFYEKYYVSVESRIFKAYGVNPDPLFSLPYHIGSIPLNEDLSVRFFAQVLYNTQLDKSALTDATFVVFAIILVYIFSYFHIVSLQLCSMAVVQF